jgi:preprotein translocase subunit Sss1
VVWTSGVPFVPSPEQLFINEDAEKVPYADQLEKIGSQTKETVRYGLAPFFGGPEDPQMEALGLRLTTDTKKPSPDEYSELEEQQNIDRITDTTVDEFGNVVKPSREESDFQLMMMYIKNFARSINLID